jgi:hypothetical protein
MVSENGAASCNSVFVFISMCIFSEHRIMEAAVPAAASVKRCALSVRRFFSKFT